MKGTCKNSATSSKDETRESWALKKGDEVQIKGIHNIFNKIITENFPNLQKDLPIHVQEAYRTPNRLDQNRTSPRHIIVKTISTENRERKLKDIKTKNK
jgi:hypothetical protein